MVHGSSAEKKKEIVIRQDTGLQTLWGRGHWDAWFYLGNYHEAAQIAESRSQLIGRKGGFTLDKMELKWECADVLNHSIDILDGLNLLHHECASDRAVSYERVHLLLRRSQGKYFATIPHHAEELQGKFQRGCSGNDCR